MQSIRNTPQAAPAPKPRNADPLRQHACIYAIIRFIDDNVQPMYSRDVQFQNKWQYHNEGYWLTKFQNMIERETPPGWTGRVVEAAIFRCFDGNRTGKICQFTKGKGWYVEN